MMQFKEHPTIPLPTQAESWTVADDAADLATLRDSWGDQVLVDVTGTALRAAVSDLPVTT